MNSQRWPDKSQEGVLPKMAEGETNGIFNRDPTSIGQEPTQKNLSDYFFKMSGGKFLLSGDIFPIQVPVTYIPPGRSNFFQRQAQMNKEAIKWIAEHYPDFDWSKYDQRTNSPNFEKDNSNSEPDGILDYVVFMHREKGSKGAASPGSMKIPGTSYRIRDGHTGIKSYDDAPHNWLYFKHEFSHTLFRCPHYLGANSANGQHLYTQKGWGLMSAWHAPFFTANAWESWWLGWLEPQAIQTSGTYQLKDYLTGRDAIRIAIPGTQDHLWIENHQKKDPYWDGKQFFKQNKALGEGPSDPGIYAYVVAPPGGDRSKPRLNPYNTRHTNIIRMYNAEGNFDYAYTGESKHNGFFDAAVLKKTNPNPIAGQNDFQFILKDYNRDGKVHAPPSHGNLDNKKGEQKGVWAELKGNEVELTFGNTGDGNDAFKVGDEIGLSGIVPITNYPYYHPKNQELEPYILSGISIRLLDRDASGTYTLDIQLDDWELRNNQRWCGHILLSSHKDSIPNNTTLDYLRIKKKVAISLDQSETVDRSTPHPKTGTFSNPSQLTVEKDRGIWVEKKASLTIHSLSTLTIKSGGSLYLDKKGELHVNGTLRLEEGAILEISPKATLHLYPGSSFDVAGDSLQQVRIRGKLKDFRDPTSRDTE